MKKSAKQLMAEYILNCGEDICSACSWMSKCNDECERLEEEGKDFTPPEQNVCIKGIINYFESKAVMDRLKND